MSAQFSSVLGVAFETVIFWVALGFFLTFGVVFPALLFAVAMLEKQHVRPLRQLDEAERPPTRAEVVDNARAAGFELLGVYSDGDKGFKEGILSMLISEDGQILVLVLHSRVAGRTRLLTRLDDGRWIVTGDSTVVDLSGIEDEAVLPKAHFGALLYYHRRRVESVGAAVAAFDPASAADSLHEHQRDRASAMVQFGLARYIAQDQSAFRYTIRGAARIVSGYMRQIRQVRQQQQVAKEVERDLREESHVAR